MQNRCKNAFRPLVLPMQFFKRSFINFDTPRNKSLRRGEGGCSNTFGRKVIRVGSRRASRLQRSHLNPAPASITPRSLHRPSPAAVTSLQVLGSHPSRNRVRKRLVGGGRWWSTLRRAPPGVPEPGCCTCAHPDVQPMDVQLQDCRSEARHHLQALRDRSCTHRT